MIADDFNGDGNLDVVMNTNDFGTESTVGRYDALNGLYLVGMEREISLQHQLLKAVFLFRVTERLW